MRYSLLFLFFSLLPAALGAPQLTTNPQPFVCGSTDPPESLLEEIRSFTSNSVNRNAARNESITVDTYFHVVTSANGRVRPTNTQLNAQIQVMNEAYSSMDIFFNLISTSRTVNSAWARGDDEQDMKSSLRKGTYSSLNIYFLSDIGPNLLGYCYFPSRAGGNPNGSDFILDGCVVEGDSVPGGNAVPFDKGITAVHEVGHWFGLFHVFQGSVCSGDAGDMISDTPAQREPTSGCPTRKDSCPNQQGFDSVNNFMDYSDDACLSEFTAGQTSRVRELWFSLRDGK